VVYGLVIALVMIAAARPFALLFTSDPRVLAEFSRYLGIAAWGYAGFGLLIVANGIMNTVDRAKSALVQSVLRVFAVMLPVAMVMQPAWGSAAIYAAELAANLFGGLSAIVLVHHIMRGHAPAAAPR
jgi:Na+-driven multidrug efflux pump